MPVTLPLQAKRQSKTTEDNVKRLICVRLSFQDDLLFLLCVLYFVKARQFLTPSGARMKIFLLLFPFIPSGMGAWKPNLIRWNWTSWKRWKYWQGDEIIIYNGRVEFYLCFFSSDIFHVTKKPTKIEFFVELPVVYRVLISPKFCFLCYVEKTSENLYTHYQLRSNALCYFRFMEFDYLVLFNENKLTERKF